MKSSNLQISCGIAQENQIILDSSALDPWHTQCVVPFANRCPISMIPPNGSSTSRFT